MPSVRDALRACGRRNALTPFAIASTPVRAVEPGSEGAEQHEQPDRADAHGHRLGCDGRSALAVEAAGRTPEHEREHRRDERVGRNCEGEPGLTDAAEVRDRDQGDAREREPEPVSAEARNRGRERHHARGDRHGHREHVVGEQRSGSDEARKRPQVVLRDHVGAAGGFVDAHRLLIRGDDDGEQGCDRDRDRQQLRAAGDEAARRTTSAASVAYATDESASDAKIGSASRFGSSVSSSSPVGFGRPTTSRLMRGLDSRSSVVNAGPRAPALRPTRAAWRSVVAGCT